MVPKRVFDEIGGFPVGVRTGEDLDMWVRIALQHRVAWSPRESAVYHLSSDNRTAGGEVRFDRPDVACAAAIEEFLASGRQPISARSYVEEYVAGKRLDLAKYDLLQGRRDWARALVRKTQATVLFKKQRRLLQIMLLFPTWLLRIVVGCVRRCR